MNPTKNYTKNANYFKKSGTAGIVGIALLILSGVILLFGWSYVSYLIMCASTVVGLALLLCNTLTRTGEKDLDAELEHLLRDVNVNAERDLKAGSRLLAEVSPETVEGYELRQGVMLRKDQNGKLRSSQYTRAILYPQEQKLTVRYKTVSLVSAQYAEKTVDVPYADLASIGLREETRRLTFGKQGFTVNAVTLELKWGNTRISIPAARNIRTEELAERIAELAAGAGARDLQDRP